MTGGKYTLYRDWETMKRKPGQVRGDEDVPNHSNLDYRRHNEKKSKATHLKMAESLTGGQTTITDTRTMISPSVVLYPCTGGTPYTDAE